MSSTATRLRNRAIGAVLGSLAVASGHAFPTAVPSYQVGFPVVLAGDKVRLGSVTVADVDGDGRDDAVVGGLDGKVHVYNGDGLRLWLFDTGAMSVESKPAVADLDGDGDVEVVVTAGSTQTPSSHGGLYVLDHLGNLVCQYLPADDGDADAWREGIFSSPAVADLDDNDGGRREIAFGGWDRIVRVVNDDCTVVWERDVVDTVWSSPALADIDLDGRLDVVIGVDSDSHPGNHGELDGGLLHVYAGATGVEASGFPVQLDEVIWSSPSVGDIDGDGDPEIVVGTGYCWSNPDCAPGGRVHPGAGRYVAAFNHDGSAVSGWPVSLGNGYAFASPALADLDGDGRLDVVVNSIDPDDVDGGLVYALRGDGSALPGWPVSPSTPISMTEVAHRSTKASPIVAELDGDGRPEIVLPSNWELVVLDADGDQLTRRVFPSLDSDLQLRTQTSVGGAAAVGDLDGDGDLEVVVGGGDTDGANGVLYAWDFTARLDGVAWSMFRGGADNLGTAGTGAISSDGFESGDAGAWSAVQF